MIFCEQMPTNLLPKSHTGSILSRVPQAQTEWLFLRSGKLSCIGPHQRPGQMDLHEMT